VQTKTLDLGAAAAAEEWRGVVARLHDEQQLLSAQTAREQVVAGVDAPRCGE